MSDEGVVKMKQVRAIARGFWGRLIEPGTVFEVPEDTKLESVKDGGWMVPADSPIQEKKLPIVPQLAEKGPFDPLKRKNPPGIPEAITPEQARNLSVI